MVLNSGTQLSVTYQSDDIGSVHGQYANVISGAGWTQGTQHAAGGATVTSFSKDGKTLQLTAADAAGFQSVTVVILDM